MDQRKLMDNANTITDMAKVRIGTNRQEGNLFCLRRTRDRGLKVALACSANKIQSRFVINRPLHRSSRVCPVFPDE